MTDKQLTLHNLKLLRDYWAKLSFNPRMDFFGRIMDEVIGSLTIGGINPCGTDCCALGKAPEVAGLEIQSDDFRNGLFDYVLYSGRIFPYLEGAGDLELYWCFLFGSHNPNDRSKLIKRFDYFLKHEGEKLEEFEYAE